MRTDGSRTNGNASSDNKTPTTEVELKLLCSQEELSKLEQIPSIADSVRDEGKATVLTAVYYDTPELDLRKAGVALRVRTDGKRFIMTLKSKRKADGGALERTESRVSVATMEPDRTALARFLAADGMPGIDDDQPLQQVFTTEVQRRTWVLELPSGVVELAIDRGLIKAGERFEKIREIEIELIDGDAAALFVLAREIVSHIDVRPSIRSKSERGFALALDQTPKVCKARKTAFNADATLDDALQGIFRSVFRHLMENQPAAEDGRDPEGVHQYRVALRRLRSALRLIRAVSPSARRHEDNAQRLMASLDGARNWDVFVNETLPRISRTIPVIEGFEAIRKAADDRRQAAYEEARSAIADPKTGQFQIELGLWIEQAGWRADASPKALALLGGPARDFAAEELARLRRRILRRGRNFKELSAGERHKLRLAVKKLRYAADFFLHSTAKRKAASRYAKDLARLQNALGFHNDMVVLGELVERLLGCEIPAEGNRAAGALLGWQAASAGIDSTELLSAWKKFKNADLP